MAAKAFLSLLELAHAQSQGESPQILHHRSTSPEASRGVYRPRARMGTAVKALLGVPAAAFVSLGAAARRRRAGGARRNISRCSVQEDMTSTRTAVIGWYNFAWAKGSFEVCFRPAGVFFCPKFQAASTWTVEGNVVSVDWGKYGKYELTFNPTTKEMSGHVVPRKEGDDANWRTATFLRDLSSLELTLLGDGAGTEWEFEWSGGSFPVKFKGDGYNHFSCEQFPAHAHWTLDTDKLRIIWGQYGNYEMEVDPVHQTMQGIAVGGNPETDWRKATLKRKLVSFGVVEDCGHQH